MRTVIFLFFFAAICLGCENQYSNLETTSSQTNTSYYYHNLLFQWKDSIEPEVKESMLDLLREIPKQIEGFESIEFYELEPSDGEFDLLVIQKYISKNAEERYQKHPDHLKAKAMGPQLIKNMAEFDYWD